MKRIILILGLAIMLASCSNDRQDVNPAPEIEVSAAVTPAPYLEFPMEAMVINGSYGIWLRNPGNLHFTWEITAVPAGVVSYSQFSLSYHPQYDSSTMANDNMRYFRASVAGWYELSLFDFNGNRVLAIGFTVHASAPYPYLAGADGVQAAAPAAMYLQLPVDPMVVNDYYYIWLRNATTTYDWEVTLSPDPSPRSYYLGMHPQYDQDTNNNANVREFSGKVQGFYMITLYDQTTGAPVIATGFTVN